MRIWKYSIPHFSSSDIALHTYHLHLIILASILLFNPARRSFQSHHFFLVFSFSTRTFMSLLEERNERIAANRLKLMTLGLSEVKDALSIQVSAAAAATAPPKRSAPVKRAKVERDEEILPRRVTRSAVGKETVKTESGEVTYVTNTPVVHRPREVLGI